MGTSAQSTSCSRLGNNNELWRRGETEKEQLCAPGDSPVPGAKITPLVLFINSGGTGSEWHTDVVTAGSAGLTCLGLPHRGVPCRAGGCSGVSQFCIPSRAGKPAGGCFKVKSKIWAMGIPGGKDGSCRLSPKQCSAASIRPAHESPPSPGLVPR